MLEITINEQSIASAVSAIVVSDAIDFAKFKVQFPKEWDGLTNTAVFYNEDLEKSATVVGVADGTLYPIPASIIANEDTDDMKLLFSVFGVNSAGKRATSSVVSFTAKRSGLSGVDIVPGETPEDPDILDQFMQMVIAEREKAEKQVDLAKAEVTKAADHADAAGKSKTAAETAKGFAETAAAEAETKAKAAAASARTAEEKATDAAASAAAADKSKTDAETSAETVTTKATEAANSAEAAKSSQDAAARSAQTAAQKATEATESAEAAIASKTAAEKSAGTASTKATEAANSAKAAEESQDAAATSAGIATDKASDAATSAETAEIAANTATTEAAKVKTWKPMITNGILTFIVDNDPTPPEGYNVIGPEGKSPTITIGANENWFVNGVDTGKPSRGAKGDTSILTIGANGNFYIDGEDTGQKAQGPTGPPGTDGKDGRNGVDGVSPEISISADGYWEINGTKTDKKAVPENGTNGKDGKAATVRIGTVSTGAPGTQAAVNNSGTETDAVLNVTIPRGGDGTNGKDGSNGKDGAPGAKGADGATWLFGNVAPTNQGKTGDFYINTTTYDVYSKATGAWVKTGNIKGATGPQGVPGTNGKDGTNGTNGKDGAPGAKGADGKAATVSVGTVTTLQPGQPATVNNRGTTNAAVLDFGIPKGESTEHKIAAFYFRDNFRPDSDMLYAMEPKVPFSDTTFFHYSDGSEHKKLVLSPGNYKVQASACLNCGETLTDGETPYLWLSDIAGIALDMFSIGIGSSGIGYNFNGSAVFNATQEVTIQLMIDTSTGGRVFTNISAIEQAPVLVIEKIA